MVAYPSRWGPARLSAANSGLFISTLGLPSDGWGKLWVSASTLVPSRVSTEAGEGFPAVFRASIAGTPEI